MKQPFSGGLDQKMTVSKILFTLMSSCAPASETAKFLHIISPVPGCCHLCHPDTGSGKKIQLDSIMLGNCAHQIIFGRVSTTEMDIFSKMAGETLEHVTQETVTETAITAERPTYSYSRRSTPTLSERFSGTVFRYLGFQEVIFFSVNNSSPIYPFRER